MVAFATVLQQAIRKSGIGITIPNADIGSLAAGNFVSVKWLRNGNWATNHFRSMNTVIWRPQSASQPADIIRYAADLTSSSGTLAVDANWADTDKTSEDFYLLFHGVHPQWVTDAANFALAKAYVLNSEPLSFKPVGTGLSDAGFQKTATSHYTTSNATFTKVATANSENVIPGSIGSGRVVTSSAGGHIYQRFAVTEQERVHHYVLSRLDSGTNFESVLQDVTNTAAIGTTAEHDQEAWQWTVRRETIPTGCEILEVRFQGEGNGDDFFLGAQNVLFPNQSRVIIDTTWDSSFKAMKLMFADLGGSSLGNGVYQGMASQFHDIPPDDYSFVFERAGANPSYVQFKHNSQRHWFNYPIFIWGRRPYSDLTTVLISDISQSSPIDLDLWDAMFRVELFSMGDVQRKVPDAQALLGKATFDLAQINGQFAQDAESPSEKRWFSDFGRLAN